MHSLIMAVKRMLSPSLLLLLLLLLVALSSTRASTVPVVDAPWGRVQGVVVSGLENRLMHGFLGIPYAVSPVGDLRFEKPRPHPGPGQGRTFVADTVAPACIQERWLTGKERQLSEDCLILDIYVSSVTAPTPRPVMFFIHGGGFTMGDSSYFRSSRLVVDEGVVVVVIQYRLGFFGFLSTSDGALTSNLGLWDQHLALTWVRDNIAAFGGDPGTVTIFGESAGSMSVGMHTLSPHSKGLFKRAIQQSGSLSTILKISSQMSPELFANLSQALGCAGSSPQQRVACIKDLPAEDFHAKATEFQRSLPPQTQSLPVVDGDFLPAQASDVLGNEDLLAQSSLKEVETIIGFTNQEGSLVLFSQLFANLSDEAVRSRQFFDQNLYACMLMSGLASSPVLAKTTAFHYLGENYEEDRVDLQDTADMYGDCLLTAPVIDWALQLATSPHTAPRYVYIVEHQFAFNKDGPLPGSHHGDDLTLLFDVDQILLADSIFASMKKTGLAKDEKPLSTMIARLFASFARSGTPELLSPGAGTWPQFNKESQQILSFSATPRVVDKLGRYKAPWLLWNRLLPQLQDLLSAQGQGQGQGHGAADHEEVKNKEEL